MPKAQVKDKDVYKFPEDVMFPARLISVTEKTIRWQKKDRQTKELILENGKPVDMSRDMWTWTFEIEGDSADPIIGEFVGERGYRETDAEYTTRPEDVVKQFSEALLGVELEIGDELDTDTLLQMPCWIRFAHGTARPNRDGGFFYPCDVVEVSTREEGEGAPANAWAAGGDQPPF